MKQNSLRLLSIVLAPFAATVMFAALTHSASAQHTGITGGGQPISTVQPSLGLNYLVRTSLGTDSELGEVMLFAGNFEPTGWSFADGRLLNVQSNSALHAVMGATFGGDGINTFALPDLRGRTAIGAGAGTGLSPRSLGDTVGAHTVTLGTNQIPSHAHTLPPSGATGITGGNQPLDNMQPSLVLNYAMPLEGIFPSQSFAPGSVTPLSDVNNPLLGAVGMFARSALPISYTPAQGQEISISDNDALFSLIGTTYGGDGQQTFGLPDLSGRAPIGVGQGPGLSPMLLGELSGTESTTMSLAQMPSHAHTLPPTPDMTGETGGGQPLLNMQPTSGLHYIIALQGIFPSPPDAVTPAIAGVEPLLAEISLFAGNFAPRGWAFANGQQLSISQNTALFALLGTTFGGNGQTTFALPDLRGRIPVGAGQGPGLPLWSLGENDGQEVQTVTVDQFAPHDHIVPEPTALVHAGSAIVVLTFVARHMARRRARPVA